MQVTWQSMNKVYTWKQVERGRWMLHHKCHYFGQGFWPLCICKMDELWKNPEWSQWTLSFLIPPGCPLCLPWNPQTTAPWHPEWTSRIQSLFSAWLSNQIKESKCIHWKACSMLSCDEWFMVHWTPCPLPNHLWNPYWKSLYRASSFFLLFFYCLLW